MNFPQKVFIGLLLGFGVNLAMLYGSHGPSVPFLAYLAMYLYGIGISFGWSKMKGWLAKACGVGVSIEYWLLICLFFRRNGLMWGSILFILYVSFVASIGIWWGIILFIKDLCCALAHKRTSTSSQETTGSNDKASMLKVGYLLLGLFIIATTWKYWDNMTQSSQRVPVKYAQRQPIEGLRKSASPQPVVPQAVPPSQTRQQPQQTASPEREGQQAVPSANATPQWHKPYPLQADTYPYKKVAGQWRGSYTIGKVTTPLVFQITEQQGKTVAIFSFYPRGKQQNAGQFAMRCEYNPKEGRYYFFGDKWLVKPDRYSMINMNGQFANEKLVGNITDINSNGNIGYFDLAR